MRPLLVLAVVSIAAWTVAAQRSVSGDWPAAGRDAGGTRYSPLTQITPENVTRLARAWTYHTGDQGTQFEATPIVVDGVMYVSTQRQRIVALNAETGAELWAYDPHVPGSREHRGVAYWPGEPGFAPRIVFGTGDGRLIALDAKTGTPAAGFGVDGAVDLKPAALEGGRTGNLSITSPPAIVGHLIIVGPSTPEGPSVGPSGDPRAFDVRTGALVWRFNLIPHPGQPGHDTWGPDGWKNRSGPSLWAGMTVDTERGLVFLPTGNPADSFYGADRKGTNLYANCVVALDAATGTLRWFYQVVHHDIFDYDVPAAPTLIDVVKDGRRIPAVAQITKMGLLFLLDRETGKPIYGVEERPVPASDVPGEAAWPTQPFPKKPVPLARTSMTRAEVSKRTPEVEKYCTELFDSLVGRTLYAPFGTRKTLAFPGAMGGGNWGGVSFDPRLGYVFVNTSNLGAIGHLVPAAADAPVPWRNESGYMRFLDQERFPCQQPPWGELTAVDVNTGDIAWKVPLGSFPELEAQGLKNWGTPNVGGTIATASRLIFVAATNDARLRAFDSRTGKELWAGTLDAIGNATPITYAGPSGRQFVAIAAGGPGHLRNVGNVANDRADTIIAFALGGGESSRDGSPAPRPAAARFVPGPAELPADPRRDLVLRTCAGCHAVQAFSGARLSSVEWELIVADMRLRGARATDDEAKTVVSYLSQHLAR
jgi:quinoprotein glucose dehydrogenase